MTDLIFFINVLLDVYYILYFTVPSGRRGASQRTSTEINKTSAFARVRI